jgi:tetraacyldisaccharide 4'-kinase
VERLAALHRRLSGDAPAHPLDLLARGALIPLGWIYGAVLGIRAGMYHRGLLSSYRAGIPVISVGNIAVGGTGKTPAVDLLVKLLLARGIRVAVVSRGYGARIKGVRVVCAGQGPLLSSAECGDEPYLLAHRNPRALVLVSPRRGEGVRMAEEELGAEAIILDDGFQHLAVQRDLDIVLLDARRPLGNGRVLPAGILRESPSALKRGDLFLLTRCTDPPGEDPSLSGEVLHSRHVLAQKVVSLDGETAPPAALSGRRGVAFAGIADPGSFFGALERAGLNLVERIAFADHAPYGEAQIEKLRRAARNADYLITTEKDGVKLHSVVLPVPCYLMPMDLEIFEAGVLEKTIYGIVRQGESR